MLEIREQEKPLETRTIDPALGVWRRDMWLRLWVFGDGYVASAWNGLGTDYRENSACESGDDCTIIVCENEVFYSFWKQPEVCGGR
jgi:hypothetical protein